MSGVFRLANDELLLTQRSHSTWFGLHPVARGVPPRLHEEELDTYATTAWTRGSNVLTWMLDDGSLAMVYSRPPLGPQGEPTAGEHESHLVVVDPTRAKND